MIVEKDNYYCISCLGTGKGERLVSSLLCSYTNSYLGMGTNFLALSPKKIVNKQKDGIWTKKKQPFTPEYIFVCTGLKGEHLQTMISDGFCKGRIFSYGNGDRVMAGSDLEYARWFFSFDGTIGVSKVKLFPGQDVVMMSRLIRMSTAVEFLEAEEA